MGTEETINKEESARITSEVCNHINKLLGGELTEDVRRHFYAQIRGMVGRLYKAPDGKYSHHGVEKTVRENAHDKARALRK